MLTLTDFPVYSDGTTPEIGDLVFSQIEKVAGKLFDINKGPCYQQWYGKVALVTTTEVPDNLREHFKHSQMIYSFAEKKTFATKVNVRSCDMHELVKLV